VAALRGALLDAVSPEDVQAVVAALVHRARSGDVAAIRELFDRCIGKTEAVDLLQRLGELEELFQGLQEILAGRSTGWSRDRLESQAPQAREVRGGARPRR
jgi:hypothetical protein